MRRRALIAGLLFLFSSSLAFAQANRKLQIHFMDVGQGDGAVLISLEGEVVLFDDGVLNNCEKPLAYLQQLGITQIDYLIASHYHADHIGCTEQILRQFPLQNDALDRGGSYPSATFNRYVAAVGAHRRTAEPGTTILLGSPPNWVSITVVAVNADGLETTDENSLSVVAQVRYAGFTAELGGDVVGTTRFGAVDVETRVALRVGPIDLYKAHHHCSRYSSNDTWLGITMPTVAILSMGDANTYGHPHPECVDRLHHAGVVMTYWTETGNGAEPQPGQDVVAGNIVVETEIPEEGDQVFTVTVAGAPPDVYPVRGGMGGVSDPAFRDFRQNAAVISSRPALSGASLAGIGAPAAGSAGSEKLPATPAEP